MPTDGQNSQCDRQNRLQVRLRPLGSDDPPADVLDDLTPGERLELLHELSARMWELTGRPVPDYERSKMPVRTVRRA